MTRRALWYAMWSAVVLAVGAGTALFVRWAVLTWHP